MHVCAHRKRRHATQATEMSLAGLCQCEWHSCGGTVMVMVVMVAQLWWQVALGLDAVNKALLRHELLRHVQHRDV